MEFSFRIGIVENTIRKTTPKNWHLDKKQAKRFVPLPMEFGIYYDIWYGIISNATPLQNA